MEENQTKIQQEELKLSFQLAQHCSQWVLKLEQSAVIASRSKEDIKILRLAYTKIYNKIIADWPSPPPPLAKITAKEVLTHLSGKNWNDPLGEFTLGNHVCDKLLQIIVTLAYSATETQEEIAPLFAAAILNIGRRSPRKTTNLFGENTRKSKSITEKHLRRAIVQGCSSDTKVQLQQELRAKQRKEQVDLSKAYTQNALDIFSKKVAERTHPDAMIQSLIHGIHHEFYSRTQNISESLATKKSIPPHAILKQLHSIPQKDFCVPSRAFAVYRNLLPSIGRHLEENLDFAQKYADDLEKSARMTITDMNESGYEKTAQEVISAPYFQISQYFSHGLLGLYIRHGIPSDIQEKLVDLIPLDPKDEYPRARALQRHFIIHVGSTNTGKTYQALQRLKEAKTGVYLSPLRLLALEVQENLRDSQIACGLLTGEEEDLSPYDTHMASTVEKLNLYQHYEVAVLDECQMIADASRGFAWTRGILGCLADEIHCCVAPEGLDILIKIIEHCGDSHQVMEHQRKVPLTYQDRAVPLSAAKKGDAFVAFSRKTVLFLAQQLIGLGYSVSVIYGALPYQARRAQMERFLAGETQILVATDAIGMGLNLPIRRVIFTADSKFDGTETRALLPGEVKQIGGRAGRFGRYDEGFVCRCQEDLNIQSALLDPTPRLDTARLGFSELILSLDFDIEDILKVWSALPDKPPFVKMDIDRYLDIINRLRYHSIELSKADLLKASIIPFDEGNNILWAQFMDYILSYTEEEPIEFPTLHSKRLQDLEIYMKKLELYYSFSKNFDYDYDYELLSAEKEKTTTRINETLLALRSTTEKKGKKHKNGGGKL